MSDYFFYDLNKKMADLATKQQLDETAQTTPVKTAPSALRTQLNERDMGKHNNATTGFAALAKKTGGGEKGAKIAGAQLAKMRAKGQVEESKKECPPMSHIKKMCQDGKSLAEICKMHPDCDQAKLKQMVADCKKKLSEGSKPDFLDLDKDGNRKEPMRSAARGAKKGVADGSVTPNITVNKVHDDGHEKEWHIYRGKEMIGYVIKNQPDTAEGLYIAYGHGPGRAFVEEFAGLKPAVNYIASLKEGVAEGVCSACDCNPCKCNSMDESALQAAFGKKKYTEPGMKELQRLGRIGASEKTKAAARKKFDQYDESMTDEGNAFSGAVVKAKRDGIQPGEKVRVGGKQYKLRETDATPQDTGSYEDEVKAANAPQRKASAPRPPVPPPKKTMPPKPKMYPPQAIDDPVKEAAKYRAPKYKDKLYTQEPLDHTFGPDMDAAYHNDYPDDYAGRKSPMDSGRGDPLTRGFRMSADKSINSHGKRKGLPSRDQISSLKGSIKAAHGTHAEPNLPEGGVPMTPKQKKFAALAKPFDKISFADKIVGAKKEVDEMLGDVAATAMKKAVRGRNRDMEEASDWSKLHEPFKAGDFDDTPTRRKSSSGGEIDTSASGVTRHRPVKGNYSGAAHDAGADTEPSGAVGRRKVGAGQGKKIGAKINRGTSKLMTDEGDMPEDMIEPQDSGEYDREGDMAKDTIKTVVRHAQALEKILGDNDNLPEWVQSKLAKIENMMTAVDDYMQNQKSNDMGSNDQEMDEERTSKRDNRAERAGRRVAKDIEYDEKKKDGIHGRRRGSEDSRAERAGKKVTKDIEYDEKKDKKKKEVDETTTSGSVATGSAPKSSGGHSYGKGIYDSLNRQLENMISEGMNINMSINNDEHGGPRQSLTVTATDEDALMLAGLLKMAGMGTGDDHIHAMTGDDPEMLAIQTMDHMHGDEPCADCGSSPCACDDEMMDEAYGDTDETKNHPDWPTDEEGTDNAMMYSGGLNGPKSTGQTTAPVNAALKDRLGYEGDNDLRRMMEIAGLR